MRKIISIVLVVIIIAFCCGCNKNNNNITSETKSYKIALVCNFDDAKDGKIGANIYKSISDFYGLENHPGRKFHPRSDESLHIISSVESAITDGYNVITVIGNEYGNAVSSIAAEYPYIIFVVFGMSGAIALHNNVYCSNIGVDYLAFYNSILK